ncbi:hypothetical protein TKK_0019524 [Trichogramma kaykai]
MWELLAASGLVQKYTCKDDGGTSTSTGLHHRWTRTKEDFNIEVDAAVTQGDLRGLHHHRTRTKEDFNIERGLQGIFGNFFNDGHHRDQGSSSGGQHQGGFQEAPAVVMLPMDLRGLAVRELNNCLKNEPAVEHVWKTHVNWRKIAQTINAGGHGKDLGKGINKLLRSNDTKILVAQGITLEQARHLIACYAFAHPVPRGQASRSQIKISNSKP